MTKKKKIIIFGTIFLILLFLFVFLFFYSKKVPIDNEGYTLINSLEAEVYEKYHVLDFIEEKNLKVEDNFLLDTSTLGTKEVEFIYYDKNNKKKKGIFEIEVIDNEAPLVWLNTTYSVEVGTNEDALSQIMCVDNYDANPICKIEGEYNLNQAGNYNLTYRAIDSSQNEQEIPFTLRVYEKKVTGSKGTSLKVTTDFEEVVATYKNDDTLVGIDVSKWQGEIDFEKVKASGASFVMIRVGSQRGVGGEYVLDPYFKENMEKALAAGLEVGTYFYSYADGKKEAIKQAEWVLKMISPYDLTLPVVFDWECYSFLNEMEISLFGLNEIANAFLETIEKNNYSVMLYGSKNYLEAIWKYHEYPVWLAHYTKETDYKEEYVMWQLCQNGRIPGIEGDVDIDILYLNK